MTPPLAAVDEVGRLPVSSLREQLRTALAGPAPFHRRTREAEHLDVRFVLVADGAAVPVIDESTDVRWWRVDDLPADAAPDLPALVRAAAQRVSRTW